MNPVCGGHVFCCWAIPWAGGVYINNIFGLGKLNSFCYFFSYSVSHSQIPTLSTNYNKVLLDEQ